METMRQLANSARLIGVMAVLSCCLPRSGAQGAKTADPGVCILQGRYLIFFAPDVIDPVASTAQPRNLARRASGLLDAVAEGWRHNPGPLLIAGHVDEQEVRQGMKGLDAARAEAVRRGLVMRGVAEDALWTRGDDFRGAMLPDVKGPEIQNRFVSVTAPNAMADCTHAPMP